LHQDGGGAKRINGINVVAMPMCEPNISERITFIANALDE
jgi:hypothetical protein